MAGEQDTAALMAEFLEFKAAREAAAAEDNDPDNERDIVLTSGETSISLPWRKAKEFDLEGLLGAKFGLKRKAAAPAAGGEGDGGTGGGKGKTGTQGTGQGGGAGAVTNLFRTGGKGKAAS